MCVFQYSRALGGTCSGIHTYWGTSHALMTGIPSCPDGDAFGTASYLGCNLCCFREVDRSLCAAGGLRLKSIPDRPATVWKGPPSVQPPCGAIPGPAAQCATLRCRQRSSRRSQWQQPPSSTSTRRRGPATAIHAVLEPSMRARVAKPPGQRRGRAL